MNWRASPFLAWTVFMNLCLLSATATTSSSFSSGDFPVKNPSYPLCNSTAPAYIGDSYCNSYNNKEECGYDGGDCCECTCEGDLCGARVFECIDPSAPCVNSPFDTPAPTIVASLPPVSGIPAPTTAAETLVPAVVTTQSPAATHPLITLSPTSTLTSSPTTVEPIPAATSFPTLASLMLSPTEPEPLMLSPTLPEIFSLTAVPTTTPEPTAIMANLIVGSPEPIDGTLGPTAATPEPTAAKPEPTAVTPEPTTGTLDPTLPAPQSECDVYGGNGFCDGDNNNKECEFDRGDCCPCACVDGVKFECGYNGFDCTGADQICAPTPTPTRPNGHTPTRPPTPVPIATETPSQPHTEKSPEWSVDPATSRLTPSHNELTPQPTPPILIYINDRTPEPTPWPTVEPPVQEPIPPTVSEPVVSTTPNPVALPMMEEYEPTNQAPMVSPTPDTPEPHTDPTPQPTPPVLIGFNDPTPEPIPWPSVEPPVQEPIPPTVSEPVVSTTPDPVALQMMEEYEPTNQAPMVSPTPDTPEPHTDPTPNPTPPVLIGFNDPTPEPTPWPTVEPPVQEPIHPTVSESVVSTTPDPVALPMMEEYEPTNQAPMVSPTTDTPEPHTDPTPQPTPPVLIGFNDPTPEPIPWPSVERPVQEPIHPTVSESVVSTTPDPVALPMMEEYEPTNQAPMVSPTPDTPDPHTEPTPQPTPPAPIGFNGPTPEPTPWPSVEPPVQESIPPTVSEPVVSTTPDPVALPMMEEYEPTNQAPMVSPTPDTPEPHTESTSQPTPPAPIGFNDPTPEPTPWPSVEPPVQEPIPPTVSQPVVPTTPDPVALPMMEEYERTNQAPMVSPTPDTPEPHTDPTPQPTPPVLIGFNDPTPEPTPWPSVEPPVQEPIPPTVSEPVVSTTPDPVALPMMEEYEPTNQAPMVSSTPDTPEPHTDPTPHPTPPAPIGFNDPTPEPTPWPSVEPPVQEPIPPTVSEPVVPTTPDPVALPMMEEYEPTNQAPMVSPTPDTPEPHTDPTPQPTPPVLIGFNDPTPEPTPWPSVEPPVQEPIPPTVSEPVVSTTPDPVALPMMEEYEPTNQAPMVSPTPDTPEPHTEPTSQPTPPATLGFNDPTPEPIPWPSVEPPVQEPIPPTVSEPVVPTTPDPVALPMMEEYEPTNQAPMVSPTPDTPEPHTDPTPQPTPPAPIGFNDPTPEPTPWPSVEPPVQEPIPPTVSEPVVPTTPDPVALPMMEEYEPTNQAPMVSSTPDTPEPHTDPAPQPTPPAPIGFNDPTPEPTPWPSVEPPVQEPIPPTVSEPVVPTTPDPVILPMMEEYEPTNQVPMVSPTPDTPEPHTDPAPQPTPPAPIGFNDPTPEPTPWPTINPLVQKPIPPTVSEPVVPTTPDPVVLPMMEEYEPTNQAPMVSPTPDTPEPHTDPAPHPTPPAPIGFNDPTPEPTPWPTVEPPVQEPISFTVSEPVVSTTPDPVALPMMEEYEPTNQAPMVSPTLGTPDPHTDLTPQPTPPVPIGFIDPTPEPTPWPTVERPVQEPIPPTVFEPVVPTTPDPVALPMMEEYEPTNQAPMVSPTPDTPEPHADPTPQPTPTVIIGFNDPTPEPTPWRSVEPPVQKPIPSTVSESLVPITPDPVALPMMEEYEPTNQAPMVSPTLGTPDPHTDPTPQPTPPVPIGFNDPTPEPTPWPSVQRPVQEPIPPTVFEPVVPTTPDPVALPMMEEYEPTNQAPMVSPTPDTPEPHADPTPQPTPTVIIGFNDPTPEPTPWPSVEPPVQKPIPSTVSESLVPITPDPVALPMMEEYEPTNQAPMVSPTLETPEPHTDPALQPTPPVIIGFNGPTPEPTPWPSVEPPVQEPIPPTVSEPVVSTTPDPVALPMMEEYEPTNQAPMVSPPLYTPEPIAPPSPSLVFPSSTEPTLVPRTEKIIHSSAEMPPPLQPSSSGNLEPSITPTPEPTDLPEQKSKITSQPSVSREWSVEPATPRPTTPRTEPTPQPTPPVQIDINDPTPKHTPWPSVQPPVQEPIFPTISEPVVSTTPDPVALPLMQEVEPTNQAPIVSPTRNTPEPISAPNPALVIPPPAEPTASSPTGEVIHPSTGTPPPVQPSTSGSLEPSITPSSKLTDVPDQAPGTTPQPPELPMSSVEPVIPTPPTQPTEPNTETTPQPTPSGLIPRNYPTPEPTRGQTVKPTTREPISPTLSGPVVPTTPDPVALPIMPEVEPTNHAPIIAPTSDTPEPITPVSPALVIRPSAEPATPLPTEKVSHTSEDTPSPLFTSTPRILESTITPTPSLTDVPEQTSRTTPQPSESPESSVEPVISTSPTQHTEPNTETTPQPTPSVLTPRNYPTPEPTRGQIVEPTTRDTISPSLSGPVVPTTPDSVALPMMQEIEPTNQAPMISPTTVTPEQIASSTPALVFRPSAGPTTPLPTEKVPHSSAETPLPLHTSTPRTLEPMVNPTPALTNAPEQTPRTTPRPSEPGTAPGSASSAFESPNATSNISTKAPLIFSPATETPLVSPPSSTAIRSATPIPQSSTLSPTGAPTLYDTPAAFVQPRAITIGTVTFVAAGGVTLSFLGSMLPRERDVESRTREIGTADVQAAHYAGGTSHYTSHRKPSATLAAILMSQLQFVATLSLVDYIVEEEPWLRDFCTRLRWVNLWWPASFANDSTTTSGTTRRALNVNSLDNSGDIGSAVAVGNLTLIFGLLLCIFLLHLFVVSGVEAHWLSKQQAIITLNRAQRSSITVGELYFRTFGASRGGRVRQRGSTVLPDDDPDTECDSSSGKRKMSPLNPTSTAPQKSPTCEESSVWDIKDSTEGQSGDQEYGYVVVRRPLQRAADPIAECRDMSASAWLYFPHIELLFLFFAFQGVVAAQVAAVRNAQHALLKIVASLVLVLYPALMLAGIYRTIVIRLCSEETVQFREIPQGNDVGSLALPSTTASSGARSLFSRANKGRWHTALTADGIVRRERNWFRIGFEPLFVDFNQSGVWFAMLFLVECTVLACVGVLVGSSIVQLFLFCSINTATFVVVVISRPFANKITDGMAAMVAFTNAACMALMATSALAWNGTPRAEQANVAVATVQFILLCALAIPAYMDLTSAVTYGLSRFATTAKNEAKSTKKEIEGDDIDAGMFVRRFARRIWARTWCTLLVENLFTCMRDTYKGLTHSRARYRIAPYPASVTDSLGAHVPSRNFGVNVVGTFANPLVVVAEGGGSMVAKGALSESNAEDTTMRDDIKQDRLNFTESPGIGLGEAMMESKVQAVETIATTTSQKRGPRWGRRGQEPVEIDLPHRKSGYADAVRDIERVNGRERYRHSIDGASADKDGLQSTLHTSGVSTVRWGMKSQGPFALDLPRRRSAIARYSPSERNSEEKTDQKDQVIIQCRSQRHESLSNDVLPYQPEILQDGEALNEKDTVDQHCGSSKETQQGGETKIRMPELEIGQVNIHGKGWAPSSTIPVAIDHPRRALGYTGGAERADDSELESNRVTLVKGGRKEALGDRKWDTNSEGVWQAGYQKKYIRGPTPTDLPRRVEDRSAGSINSGQVDHYTPHLHHLDITRDLKHTDYSSGVKLTFGRWDKTTQEPVPIDLPRRRPSHHLVPETVDVVENRSADSINNGQVDKNTQRLHHLDNTADLKRTNYSIGTKLTLGRWDKTTQEPVPIDLPRRRPSYRLVSEAVDVSEGDNFRERNKNMNTTSDEEH